MKKAKVLLAAIAVFAIASGVVAFKAKTVSAVFYAYTSSFVSGGVTYPGCYKTVILHAIPDPNGTPTSLCTTTFATSNRDWCTTKILFDE